MTRREMMKKTTLLLASTLVSNTAHALEPQAESIKKQIKSYQGEIDIETIGNRIYLFLDSERFAGVVDVGYNVSLFMQCVSEPSPFPDGTLREATISFTKNAVLIVSDIDSVTISFRFTTIDPFVKRHHFPNYEYLSYTGIALGYGVHPVLDSLKAQSGVVKQGRGDFCYAGGQGASSCSIVLCSVDCLKDPTMYACCSMMGCYCVSSTRAVISESLCVGCGACLSACAVEAIKAHDRTYQVGAECVACGLCYNTCQYEAISFI